MELIMKKKIFSVRPQTIEDNELIANYFLNADTDFLLKMGVDKSKLYKKAYWLNLLSENFHLEDDKKQLYYLIWLEDNMPIGHCNINKIVTNKEAYMHLHLWQSNQRQKGLGLEFIKLAIPILFQVFNLEKLFCEPYALNPAPNRILSKYGFEFVLNYETTPGIFNFYQPVNKWCLTKEKLELCKR